MACPKCSYDGIGFRPGKGVPRPGTLAWHDVTVDALSVFRCYLSRSQHPSDRFQGNSCFYTRMVTSSSLTLKTMTSSLSNLIGCYGDLIGYQGTQLPPSGDFFYFPTLLSIERSDVFQSPSRLHAFPPAGACERECFRLAGIIIAEGDSRQELIETLATGEYSGASAIY